jgi:hypothetical protein
MIRDFSIFDFMDKAKLSIPLNSDRFVIHKGCAGLGNRIASLLTTILYCKITDRTLSVDWSDDKYSDGSINTFNRLFSLDKLRTLDNLCLNPDENFSVYPHLWEGKLALSFFDIRNQDNIRLSSGGKQFFKRYAADFRNIKYEEDVLIASSYTERIDLFRRHFKGPFKSLKGIPTEEILRKLYHDHLKINPEVQEEAEQFRKNQLGNDDVIGIHVRQSDIKIGLGRYRKALANFVSEKPFAAVFLATDNLAVEKEFKNLYPNIITKQKWMPEPGQAMHGNNSCPDLVRHAIDSLVELYILSRCESIIYSQRTSFGRTAVLMSALPENKCFDVDVFDRQRKKTFRERQRWFLGQIKAKSKHFTDRVKLEIAKIQGF